MAEIISYKRLAKLPRVVLEGTMLQQVRKWFDENHLSPLVPPIFNRFVIEYPASIKCSVPVSDVPRFLAGGFERPNDDELDQYSEMKIPHEYDKHLTYIAPYICRRGDEKKKPRAAEYRITEGDKEE